MIPNKEIIEKKYTFVCRTLINSFASAIEHLTGHRKVAQQMLEKATKIEDKMKYIEASQSLDVWLESLDVSSSEADLLLNFAKYLMVIEFENTKMKMHISYVYNENLWLRTEMFDLHKLLLKLERMCLAADSEKKYLQNYYNMRNYAKVSGKLYFSGNQGDINQEEEDTEPEEDIPVSLTSLFHLVTQFMSENRHLVATSWCNKTIVDFKKKFGEVSKEVGAVYNLLGRIYKSYGAFPLAKDNFELALGIREKVHGKDSDQVGITLSLLGSTYGKMKNFKKGLEACKNALVIREAIYGKNNEIAHLYAKIADFSFHLKLWNDTITNYKVCLVIFDNIYDITEFTIIKNYTTLAHAYINTKVMDHALEALVKVNTAYIKKNNPGTNKLVTPISLIEDHLKKETTELSSELFIQRFGTISDTLDDRVVEIMILYYDKMSKPNAVEVLKGWSDLSNRDVVMNENSKPSLASHITRKLSLSSFKNAKSTGEKGRRESLSSSVKQGFKSMFKGKK